MSPLSFLCSTLLRGWFLNRCTPHLCTISYRLVGKAHMIGFILSWSKHSPTLSSRNPLGLSTKMPLSENKHNNLGGGGFTERQWGKKVGISATESVKEVSGIKIQGTTEQYTTLPKKRGLEMLETFAINPLCICKCHSERSVLGSNTEKYKYRQWKVCLFVCKNSH